MIEKRFQRALLYGITAGMRTSSPLVGCAQKEKAWEWFALLGEMVVDKLPCTPNRTMPGAWCARVATASYSAYNDVEKTASGAEKDASERLEQGVIAGVTACVATKLAFEVRRFIPKALKIPDHFVALGEDALMLACVVHLRDRGGIIDAE